MKIAPLDQAVRDVFLKPFHLNPKHVVEVVQGPDSGEVVKVDDLELRIFMKTVETGAQSLTTIAVCEFKDERMLIRHVYRIPSDVMEDFTESPTPLKVLEGFARRYGLMMTLGDTKDTFFLEKVVPLPWDMYTKAIEVDRSKPGIMTLYCRPGENYGEAVLRCTLAFAIDRDKYQRGIGK